MAGIKTISVNKSRVKWTLGHRSVLAWVLLNNVLIGALAIQQCFECSDVSSLDLCTQTVECAHDEVCFTHRREVSEGTYVYSGGCTTKQFCDAGHPNVHTTEVPVEQGLGHIIGRKRRQETGTCYKCCSSTGSTKEPCNNQLCKVPTTPLMCHQCGDIGGVIPCITSEVISDHLAPCPTGYFCMTDLYHYFDGSINIYKRCVNEATCQNMWLKSTSTNGNCMNFVHHHRPQAQYTNYDCHFCCTQDGCNSKIAPANNTLYYASP